MSKKMPYETPNIYVTWMGCEDVITTSIVDNDGDYRDWNSDGEGW